MTATSIPHSTGGLAVSELRMISVGEEQREAGVQVRALGSDDGTVPSCSDTPASADTQDIGKHAPVGAIWCPKDGGAADEREVNEPQLPSPTRPPRQSSAASWFGDEDIRVGDREGGNADG
ncbi:unnamed protein product, partial [Discosporangium mesarthrocarpum]